LAAATILNYKKTTQHFELSPNLTDYRYVLSGGMVNFEFFTKNQVGIGHHFDEML